MKNDFQEILSKIPDNELRSHLTHRLKNDLCQTFRYIKELESIQFDETQIEIFKKVPAPEFLIENGRLIRGKYVKIER